MSDTDRAPPFLSVSSDNHAPWVVVASCILIVLSGLTVAAKIIFRLKSAKPSLYDAFLAAATLVAVAETVCVVLACGHGLGKHRSHIDDADFELVNKFYCTGSILAVASLALSKTSILQFIVALNPQQNVVDSCYGTLAIVVVWAASSLLALALQFEPTLHVDQRALYVYIGVVNILTDVALIAIPTHLMFLIRKISARLEIIAYFAVRIVVPVFTIIYLVSLSSRFPSEDPTWDAVIPTIWHQVMLNLSIITACIPSLKRVLDAFRSGAAAASISTPYQLTVSKQSSLGRLRLRAKGREDPSSRGNSSADGNRERRQHGRSSHISASDSERTIPTNSGWKVTKTAGLAEDVPEIHPEVELDGRSQGDVSETTGPLGDEQSGHVHI
ncbi:hypothetical protein BDY21DRAFT_357848 [Lineolata rhizophorae]|uniref:Rhodopsin domain-containing protein n=1 Tax=Lineolata rhizophorae TaxID=578093 RepID=A0A6A6NMD4_9PEZI|nr:hypothetical protein BDY21DRAFT_357848 [Lineolata rhizophorae]